jgi:glycosyltransferase involved in cell wall biosynthesis
VADRLTLDFRHWAIQTRTQANRCADDEVLSFVNRNLEPGRGCQRFMRALPDILRRRPQAQAVIVGGGGVSCGARPASGSFQQRLLDAVRPLMPDQALGRIHFAGTLTHAARMNLFQVARAHVYLSCPFVPSWSMLEAMASGAVVIGPDRPRGIRWIGGMGAEPGGFQGILEPQGSATRALARRPPRTNPCAGEDARLRIRGAVAPDFFAGTSGVRLSR